MTVFVRIVLRYAAAALVAKGIFSPDDANMLTGDPELAGLIEAGIGLGLGALTEFWYWIAKRSGWKL